MRIWEPTYVDFVEEIRRGKVIKIVADVSQNTEEVKIEESYTKHNWAIPSFDFGHLFDPIDPSYLGYDESAKLWGQGLNLLGRGELHLPYPECAFLFRFKADLANPAGVNLMHLQENNDHEITGDIYFRQNHSKPRDRWAKAPVQFSLLVGGEVEVSFDPEMEWSDAEMAEHQRILSVKYNECVYGAVLTTLYRSVVKVEEQADEKLNSVNRGRTGIAKLPPLPATRVINVCREALIKKVGATAIAGILKRPHERRGFYRNLASGKKTWVRATSVKGGSATAPNYAVMKRPRTE